MGAIQITDATGASKYMSVKGAGTVASPFSPEHNLTKYASIVDEINFAENTTLNSYTQPLFRDDEFFDTVLGAGGTCVWSQAVGGCTMTVSAAGDYVIRQARLSSQYLAAAPHIWDLTTVDISPVTGVVKRYGYHSTTTVAPYVTGCDGFLLETDDTDIWFRVYKNGSVVFEKKQSQWDDPMDGTGASGLTLLKTAFHAIFCEFLYLGGTEARFGFIIGGSGAVVVHTFKNSNINAATFVNSPNQPIRYSIHRNSGSGAASIKQICAKVGSKGKNSQKTKDRPHRYNNGTAGTITASSGAEYAFIGIKLNTRFFIASLKKIILASPTADDFIIRIRRNPTLSASLTYSAVTHTGYSIAYAATPATITASGGTIVYEDSITAVANQNSVFDIDNLLMQLGQSIDGTYDEFVVTLEAITATIGIRGTLWVTSSN